MPRKIRYQKNHSLAELEWRPGELIGFDNSDPECPQPFLLAIVDRLIPKRESVNGGIDLVYLGKRDERWVLHPRGNVVGLLDPKYEWDERVPDIIKNFQGQYFVEKAYAGGNEVIAALRRDRVLSPYADWIQAGRLQTERGRIGKILEAIGLDAMLPGPVRFRY